MDDLFLFLIGCLVTIIVGAAVALLMFAAAREPRHGVDVTYRNGQWQPRERLSDRPGAAAEASPAARRAVTGANPST